MTIPTNIFALVEHFGNEVGELCADKHRSTTPMNDAQKALESAIAELAAERDAVTRHRDELLAICRRDSEAAHDAVLSGRADKLKFGAMIVRDALAELVEQRDAAVAKCAELERIAEQSRRDGQEIAAGLHERIAELERELAAAKGKLAALLDASKAGSELVEDLYGYAITDWAWKYGPEWLAQRDAFRSAIAAAEQGGA